MVREKPAREAIRTRGPYVPPDSLSNEWRYDVEAIVDGEWLRVFVELPDDPPDVIVVTVIVE
jgi:hypothetical protein